MAVNNNITMNIGLEMQNDGSSSTLSYYYPELEAPGTALSDLNQVAANWLLESPDYDNFGFAFHNSKQLMEFIN